MNKYEQYLQRKQHEYGERFDASKLDSRFVSAFNSGERIRVKFDDRIVTGTVGVTTGWVPVFILMRTSRSIGSCDVLDSSYKFTTEKNKRPIARRKGV